MLVGFVSLNACVGLVGLVGFVSLIVGLGDALLAALGGHVGDDIGMRELCIVAHPMVPADILGYNMFVTSIIVLAHFEGIN